MSSFFGFDGDAPRGTDLSAADDKTLRMAMAPLSEEELAGLIRFQETYLAHAEAPGGGEKLAEAHEAALQACAPMPLKRVEQGQALLRTFCGKRWAMQRLRDKLGRIASQQGPTADALRERIQEELERLDRDTETFARRYGEETIALLRRHEPELVALHTRLTQVLSRP